MHDPFLEDLKISSNHRIHERISVSFLHSLLDNLIEISHTKLSDDIGVILCRIDIVEVKDVGRVLELLEYFNFGV